MKIPLNWTVPIIRVVYEIWCRTLRINQINREALDTLADAGKPVILAFWHDELFALIHTRKDQPSAAIVSQSSDGELLARFLEGMGIKTARGSSSRGGVRALVKAAKFMRKEKRIICISIDGPRGPRHEVKDGVIHLARLADAHIVPVRLFMARRKIFASWDRFQLPLPFSRVKAVFADAYKPSPATKNHEEDKQSMALEIEKLKQKLDSLDLYSF